MQEEEGDRPVELEDESDGRENPEPDAKAVDGLEVAHIDEESEEEGAGDEHREAPTPESSSPEPVICLSKRSFKHHRHQTVFSEDDGKWVSARF